MTTANASASDWNAAIGYRAGHAYVGAGPGTGKTRLLVERYRALRAEGVSAAAILVLTFSRRAVQELRERLEDSGFAAGDVDVRTFHGFAARVIGGGLARFRDGRLLDGFSRALLLEAAIAATPTPSLSADVRASDRFRDDVGRLLDDLGRIAPIEPLNDASPRVRDLLAILERLREERRAVGGRDLGDLIGRALAELRAADTPASRWLRGRYRHVLVDEFQDTDRQQLELLDLLAREAQLFAVGDEAQSIYRFRGAGDGIVAAAVARFGMQRFALTVSRRCPPDVCALASATALPELPPLVSARSDGAPVEVVRVRRVDDEAHFIADAIEAEVQAGCAPDSIAVLARSFAPVGSLVAAELRRRGIAVASTGREALLADPRVAALRAGLELLAAPNDPLRWVRLLTAPPLGYDALALRFAGDRLKTLRLDASLPDALDALCDGGAVPARRLAAGLLAAAEAWRSNALGTAARRLTRRLGLLAAVVRDEPGAEVRAAGARLRLVCDALRDAQLAAPHVGIPASCAELVARFDELLPAIALDDAGLDPAAPGVRVLTVHAAKGLEFAHVFVADAVNGRFPQQPRPSTLLSDDDRAWLRARGVDGPFVVAGAEREEASLWYVAVTRASERLTILFADESLDGSAQAPSRFIPAERVPATATTVEREPLDLRTLRTGDPALRSRLLAAGAFADAPVLAAYAARGVEAFAPVADRPILTDRPLSVSSVETWLRCPRQFFYDRFAGMPRSSSHALELGTLLHAALERFHERHTDFRTIAAGAAEAWTDELFALRAATWESERFASPLEAQAAATRADVALRGYARALETEAREHPFTVEQRETSVTVRIGPHALAGKVDRVDRRPDGSLVVVDYKSGLAKSQRLEKVLADVVAGWDEDDAAGQPHPTLAGSAPSELTVQLPLYASAFPDAREVAYVYLGGARRMEERNGAVIEPTPLDEREQRFAAGLVAELRDTLLDPLAEGRLLTLSPARTDKPCRFCAYRPICPGPEDA